MNITKDTKLSELLALYPWLKTSLADINDKFRMLNSPVGKVMLGKATISEMSKRSGMDEMELIEKITALIDAHK